METFGALTALFILVIIVICLNPILAFFEHIFPPNCDRQLVKIFMKIHGCTSREVFKRAADWYLLQYPGHADSVHAEAEFIDFENNMGINFQYKMSWWVRRFLENDAREAEALGEAFERRSIASRITHRNPRQK